ncbi:MAG: hypothetical protein KF780_04390 [Sphingomonas sp.]|nr:hypothetical protein [Sphingomonas sp.]
MPRIADLVAKPAWLLHEMDIGADRIVFLPVARHVLERANFLDGRMEIAVGEPVVLSVKEALALKLSAPTEPDRFIFHVSFCGSTLLTRMLERPGRVLALREPHGLVGLADWQAKHARRRDQRVPRLADFARASLRPRWRRSERVIVKHTNWVNNLLPALCVADVRPLFIGIAPRTFLRAVFRGNRDRVAYTMLAARHFAAALPADTALLAAAVRDLPDPLDQAAAMTLVALHLQLRAFHAAMAAGGWGPEHVISYERIVSAPLETAQAVSHALDLGLTGNEIAESIARNADRDAKLAGHSFSAEGQDGVNHAIEYAHGRHFDAAMAWAAVTVPGWSTGAPDTASRSAAG